ncbi:MAG: transposase family protein [Nitrososphaera sp.]
MLNYSKISKKPRSFQSFTGIAVEQFDFLSQIIESKYKDAEKKRLSKRKRKRGIGAGRPFKLTLKDRLLMLLMYYRMYASYELIGFLFGLDQSNVYRDIKYLEPAVKSSIPIPQRKYVDAKKATTLEELQRYFPELIAITDGTEQPIPRPKDKRKRKTHYSGKKKRHTVKNQITVNLRGEIIHKPPHSPGRKNDYGIFKIKHPVLPAVMNFYDLGYLGVEKDFPKQISIIPYKKKKGMRLTDSQKEWNKLQSKIRIKAEHAISKVKKFRINCDVFRNRLCRYDVISDIVCGLVNFKIRWKEFVVIS